MNISQVGLRLRELMDVSLGNLPLSKTARRFALEALYGIQSRGSVKLSEIAKPYAKKMEHLARVRDGSKKELADGIQEILSGRRKPPFPFGPVRSDSSAQLQLFARAGP